MALNLGKATRINLLDFRTVPMRTFHITWFTFFLCFFGWFGIASLMPIVREDLNLTSSQVGHVMIGSVAITVFGRLLFGWLCDSIGPRRAYTILLLIGSLPVMAIGLSNSFESFLLFRLAIGITGASFVITQYHTSAMFAGNVVGTANATAAGWGNMGGGVALMVMPLVFAAFTAAGYLPEAAWRWTMVIPGIALFAMAFVYYFTTRDTPQGNVRFPLNTGAGDSSKAGTFRSAGSDYRVWILFLAYGACFGIELTLDNIATLYFIDTFQLGLQEAGFLAGLFGMMNLFARTLGGIFGDMAGKKYGVRGRAAVLGAFLLFEGFGILLFAGADSLVWAVTTMLLFALFLKMSNGATYAIVPFINPRAMGIVSGIVGAGGNVGAVVTGMLFSAEANTYQTNFTIIGATVVVVSMLSFLLVFSKRMNAGTPAPPLPALRPSVTP